MKPSRRWTRSCERARPATSGCRTSWPTGWPAPSAGQKHSDSPAWRPSNPATTCCSAKSLAEQEGIAVIPFNPLAGGLLTGKYQPADQPQKGRFSAEVGQNFAEVYRERYWHESGFDTVGRLNEVASDIGEPLAAVSIAWVLANPTITSVILGASNPDQLTDTLAAIDLTLPSDVKATLDDISHEYRFGDAAR